MIRYVLTYLPNTSLDFILQACDTLLVDGSYMPDIYWSVFLLKQGNATISVMQGTSYPNLVHVCNPFSGPPEYLYQPENCPYNAIRIGDIPKSSRSLEYLENSVYFGVISINNKHSISIPIQFLSAANINLMELGNLILINKSAVFEVKGVRVILHSQTCWRQKA
ncbi:hypothetical protein RIF29_27956 [Crotalaria pallida]|uniref:Uncharacterized protein n=1 Tax=Crotalaria pallida TaxID=3830 RepID=A0AAN9I2V8_CROPI